MRSSILGKESTKRSLSYAALYALIAMALLFAAGCTTDQSNFLKNPKFEKWNGLPEGWLLEGAAKVLRTGSGAGLESTGTATPFIFQTYEIRRRYRGATVTLAAWVKTNVADSAVIEFSDRKGHDARSEAHPGDGQWRLLTLTAKVPDSPGAIEFRFRNYRAASSFIREASMSVGQTPLLAKRLGGAVNAGKGYGAAGYLLLLALLCAEVFYFKKSSFIKHAKAWEAFTVLLTLTVLTLTARRPVNAAVTANIAWALIVVALLPGFIKTGAAPVKGALKRLFKLPGSVFIVASVALTLATINALRNGSVREAEMTARWAYISMLLGGASIVVRKAVKALRPVESESVMVYKRRSPGYGEEGRGKVPATGAVYAKTDAEKTLTP